MIRNTLRKPTTDGRTAIQTEEWETLWEEWMMRRTSRHLRTTVSAHHVVFPSFPPICLPHSLLFITISAILTYVFSLSASYFSPLPLLLSVCVSLLFQFIRFSVSTAVFAALHLFSLLLSCLFPPLISHLILSMCNLCPYFNPNKMCQLLNNALGNNFKYIFWIGIQMLISINDYFCVVLAHCET